MDVLVYDVNIQNVYAARAPNRPCFTKLKKTRYLANQWLHLFRLFRTSQKISIAIKDALRIFMAYLLEFNNNSLYDG